MCDIIDSFFSSSGSIEVSIVGRAPVNPRVKKLMAGVVLPPLIIPHKAGLVDGDHKVSKKQVRYLSDIIVFPIVACCSVHNTVLFPVLCTIPSSRLIHSYLYLTPTHPQVPKAIAALMGQGRKLKRGKAGHTSARSGRRSPAGRHSPASKDAAGQYV